MTDAAIRPAKRGNTFSGAKFLEQVDFLKVVQKSKPCAKTWNIFPELQTKSVRNGTTPK